MKSSVLARLGAASLLTLAALAATNAVAPAAARSDAAGGRRDSSGGRVEPVDGTPRRPSVVRGAAPALALATARDNRLGPRTGASASVAP
jgi:hypothetical protein